MTRTLLLAIPLLVLAGCAAPHAPDRAAEPASSPSLAVPASAAPPANPDPTAPPSPEVHTQNGHFMAGVGTPGAAGLPPAHWAELSVVGQCLDFDVPAHATALVGEVRWNDTMQHLTLQAENQGPHYKVVDTVASGATDHATTLHLQVDAPGEGGWSVCAHANGANAGIAFTLYATVFFTPVPDGYTAIE